MTLREVPAQQGALLMKHVEDCACTYRVGPFEDGKLIDVRCIRAYGVPEEKK